MKRLKKLLAGVLILAMTMSMFTMTAFADDDGAQTTQTSKLTIDADATGSITVHKYASNDGLDWPENTREDMLEGKPTDIPDGAVPLGGVEFEVFTVLNKEQLLEYYSGSENKDELYIPSTEDLENAYCYKTKDTIMAVDKTKTSNERDPLVFLKHAGTIITATETTGDKVKGVGTLALPVGLYLVIENKGSTDAPVENATTPFLVSVPMTLNRKGDAESVTSSEWIYDVHVYPKNGTGTTDEVKLFKGTDAYKAEYGYVTDEYFHDTKYQATYSGFEPVAGAKFKLEKYNNETEQWEQVTKQVDESGNQVNLGGADENGLLVSNQAGYISVKNLPRGEYRFVEVEAPIGYLSQDDSAWYFMITQAGKLIWIASPDINIDRDDPRNAVFDHFDSNLSGTDADVQYIFREPGERFKPDDEYQWLWNNERKDPLLEANASAYPILGGVPWVVNEKFDIDKKVVPKGTPKGDNGYDDSVYAKEADYSVGDEIPYKLTITVPKSIGSQSADYGSVFKVSDSPENMHDNIDTIKMRYYDADGKDVTSYFINLYSSLPRATQKEDEDGFEIVFFDSANWINYLEDPANGNGEGSIYVSKITIEYTATLLDSATVTAAGGNPNVAALQYSQNWEQGVFEITDRTVVYSGEIDIHKKDGANGASLEGVEFELYELIENDKLNGKTKLDLLEELEKGLTPVPGSGYVKIEKTPEKTSEDIPDDNDTSSRIWATDSNGIIRIRGLSNGTYYLVETKTKDGYNLLQKPVPVVLELGYKTVTADPASGTESREITIITGLDDDNWDENGYLPLWETVEAKVSYIDKNKITSTTKDATVDEEGKITEKASQTITIGTEGDETEGKVFGVSKEIINRQGFTLPSTGGMGTFLFTFVGVAMMAAAVILFITSKKKEAK